VEEYSIYTFNKHSIAIKGPVFYRKSKEKLKAIIPHLQVLARLSLEDKRMLVRILKVLSETVTVTGNGINDTPAL